MVVLGKNLISPEDLILFRLERMDDGYFEKFGALIKDCIHKDQAELEKVYYLPLVRILIAKDCIIQNGSSSTSHFNFLCTFKFVICNGSQLG